jgi:hypothetical protein
MILLKQISCKPTFLLTYLNPTTVSVSSQGQTDSIYFFALADRAFDKVPYTLLLFFPWHYSPNLGLGLPP